MEAIYLLVGGQQSGPYTLDQIRHSCLKKEILPTMPAWYAGLENWTTVAEVLATARVTRADVRYDRGRRATDDPNYLNREYLITLARSQNMLNWAMYASALKLMTVFIPLAGVPIYLGVAVFEIYAVHRLASCLHVRAPWIYCVGMFFPLLGLFIEIWLFARTNEVFRSEGIKVGVRGAKVRDIPA